MPRHIAACLLFGLCAISIAACDEDGERQGYYRQPPVVVQVPQPAAQAPVYAPPAYAPPPPAYYYPPPAYYGGGEED